MADNLKSAVLKHARGEAPVYNTRYLDFARHNGFTISACGVAKGNEKGRVENGVGYVWRGHRWSGKHLDKPDPA
jgi:transposase